MIRMLHQYVGDQVSIYMYQYLISPYNVRHISKADIRRIKKIIDAYMY